MYCHQTFKNHGNNTEPKPPRDKSREKTREKTRAKTRDKTRGKEDPSSGGNGA